MSADLEVKVSPPVVKGRYTSLSLIYNLGAHDIENWPTGPLSNPLPLAYYDGVDYQADLAFSQQQIPE